MILTLLTPSFASAQRAAEPRALTAPAAPRVPSATGPPAAEPPGAPPSMLAPTFPAQPVPSAARFLPPQDYRLGTGDLLEVQIAGRLEVTRQQVVVDVDGNINVPVLRAIAVGGLTLAEAQRRVTERARSLLRFADVTLAVIAPRAFEVAVSGEVQNPGTLLVTATRRLQDAIVMAGGLTPRGSVRHIELASKSGDREIDLLAFELTGDLAQNPGLEEGMRIHVPPRGPSVTLFGAVRRPGEYELGKTGSLAELLALVGGVAPNAAREDARLTRVGADGRKETVSVDLRTALVAATSVHLHGGEALFVPSLSVLQDMVELRGAFNGGTPEASKSAGVAKPTIVVQRFELARGDRVRDVLTRAGGVAPYGDLQRALIERTASSGKRQRIPIDLQRLLIEKDETQNIRLENGDVFTIPVVEDRVYVVGEVRRPGAIDYRPELTVREYIALVGGPGPRAKMQATTVTFRDGTTYVVADAPPLEPGAVVTVPR